MGKKAFHINPLIKKPLDKSNSPPYNPGVGVGIYVKSNRKTAKVHRGYDGISRPF